MSARFSSLLAPLNKLAADMGTAQLSAHARTKTSSTVVKALREVEGLLSGDAVTTPNRNHAMTVMVPLPKHLADRFPGPEYNNGHEPHLTVCFLTTEELPPGRVSEVLASLRRLCRRQAPFRLGLDVNSGLHDFGRGPTGSKALWFDVREDPDSTLAKLHHAIRRTMAQEGFPCEHQKMFRPHVTWRYVDNDQSEGERQRMAAFAASRFNDTRTWFDVRQLILTTPDGGQKVITLYPRLR